MLKSLRKLRTPADIQDFLNQLPFNHEKSGETHRTVEESLRVGEAHCFEGALIAAYALSLQGREPIILDLVADKPDFDHVVALFKEGDPTTGGWGAISKTNHAVLRYREPIYKSVRELVMSYFHEYFLDSGVKTLKKYSRPFNLSKYGDRWVRGEEDLSWLAQDLDKSPHINILTPKQIRNLRLADEVEIEAGKITEY